MMSDLFDLKYLYMDWDDRLKGKDVMTSDDVKCLRKYVNGGINCYDMVHQNECCADAEMRPFVNEKGEEWKYVYYDPNYECKRVYAEGKTI